MTDASTSSYDRFLELVPPIKELFYAYGLKSLSMDDLSRHLGISKKTLYQFVKNKEDLVEKVFLYEDPKTMELGRRVALEDCNAIEKLLNISKLAYDEIKKINPMIRFEMEKYYHATWEKIMMKKKQYVVEGMKLNMEQGIKEKLYRSDVNIDLMASIYLNTFIELHHSDICKILDVNFVQLFEVLFENHIRAISTPDGLAYFESRKAEILEYIKNNK
ncbi:MAG: TetR/AcrR family transcriptional regulator [Marinilabiliales bacterium]|nr:TetR/AcrR family transcriptional regulator [Marinilabiliales bacterium]